MIEKILIKVFERTEDPQIISILKNVVAFDFVDEVLGKTVQNYESIRSRKNEESQPFLFIDINEEGLDLQILEWTDESQEVAVKLTDRLDTVMAESECDEMED